MSEQGRLGALSDAFDESVGEEPEVEAITPEITEEITEEAPEVITEEVAAIEEGIEAPEEEVIIDPEKIARAPQWWGVKEKELWDQVPDILKAQIDKRERETSNVLTRTKEARDHFEQFTQITGPFQSIMAAEGATPMQAVETLMHTAATLQTGSPTVKAQRMAELIQHYGVPIDILDKALAGQPIQDPDQYRMQTMMQEQLAPINQFMQRQQQQEQQQYQQTYSQKQQELDNFVNQNEFAPEVENEMAQFMQMAAQSGRPISLQDAYARALQTRPDIQEVIEGRKQKEQARLDAERLALKKEASSSIGGGGTGLAGQPSPTSREGMLRQAFEDAGN